MRMISYIKRFRGKVIMAEKLNVLKARIKAVTSTHKITKTMDMIARSKTS